MTRLRLLARWESWRRRGRFDDVQAIVQFVGFPRSGHSLVGSLLNGHPEAAIAHELDAMGLFRKGIPPGRLLSLMAANAEEFSRNGRWWNGLSYALPGEEELPVRPLSVIGDKKGDWAARWSAESPDLPARFADATPLSARWVLVTRHPLDNIATLTLRQGGHYDRLRIAAGASGDFREALRDAQRDGEIARHASDEMIDDYAALCAAVEGMRQRIAEDHWHAVVYEDFVANPRAALADLARFCTLPAEAAWLDAAAGLVRESGSLSRERVEWSAAQLDRVAALVERYPFLSAYRDGVRP